MMSMAPKIDVENLTYQKAYQIRLHQHASEQNVSLKSHDVSRYEPDTYLCEIQRAKLDLSNVLLNEYCFLMAQVSPQKTAIARVDFS